MKVVIEIPDDFYKNVQDNYRLGNGDVVQIPIGCISNGTPLPKGHGRLVDADAFERRCMFDSDIEDMQDVIYALRDYKSIIEADKESEVEE